MSFDEIKAAVMALPDGEQELLLESILAGRDAEHELTAAQAEDLLRREAELDRHPEDAEDGDTVMNRLFAKYAPNVSRARP